MACLVHAIRLGPPSGNANLMIQRKLEICPLPTIAKLRPFRVKLPL